MRRREFIMLLGGAAAMWPLAARAQQPAMPSIAYLGARTPQSDAPMLAAFRQGLQDIGYIEGRNVAIDYRWFESQFDRLPALLEDLVRRQVAVIVTTGGEPAPLAAKAATTTIPIVFVGASDPVRSGLVASLNRPGGNVTGVTMLLFTLVAKQLGMLRELISAGATIAVLINPEQPEAELHLSETQAAARAIGQRLVVLRAANAADIDAAFATLAQQQAGALLVVPSPLFVVLADRIIVQAARHAVPAMYFRRELVEAGGLMSYGSNTVEAYRQAGVYAGRILKGAKPAELPVVQSTKFELVINLRTAKALGVTLPPGLLALADEVIE